MEVEAARRKCSKQSPGIKATIQNKRGQNVQFSHTEQWDFFFFPLHFFFLKPHRHPTIRHTHVDGQVGEQLAPTGTDAQRKEGKTLVSF